jgi:plastocyanin
MSDNRFNASGRDDVRPQLNLISRRNLIGGATLVAGAFGIGALGLGALAQDSTPPGGTPPVASPGASPEASPAGSPVIHTVDIAYEPKEFTIPANTDVTVTIENHGKLQHDFAVDEFDLVSDLLDAGASTTVVINAPAGTYEYHCTVAGHKEAGMVGTLTVQ